jgi:hypothetical protein
MKNSCIDYCNLTTPKLWGITNPIYKATKKFGCGDVYYKQINKECIEYNKENIIKECMKNDSDENCLYSYDKLLLRQWNTPKKILQKNLEYTNSNYVIYIIYGIYVTIILLMLYILFKKLFTNFKK